MFDGRSDRIVSPGLVVVVGGKIQGVGANAVIPTGAEVIDLGDATLLPGFMDAHTHLSGEASEDWKQDELDGLQKPIAEQALDATVHARKTLLIGFTTVRDVGSSDMIDIGLRNAIRNGKVLGPRMLVAVRGIGTTGGHCDPTAGYRPEIFNKSTGIEDAVANGADAMRAAVRLNIKRGADVIKTCATGGVLSLVSDVSSPQLTQAELDALVDEAHVLKRKTAAHAHGAEGAKRAIRAGIDSIEHGSFLDDEALDMMKARGTFLVATLMAPEGIREKLDRGIYMPPNIEAKARAAIASIKTMFRKAVAKKVRIAFGTDAAVYPHGRNAEEFRLMVDLGMRPVDALKAATSVNAELFGIADRLGTLETGKLADIIATPGDPTTNIRQTEQVFFVMKEGVVYRNDLRYALPLNH
jgi:imidazolonepropionase-like amidohydrolase